jgi:hypothetical protein
MRNKDSNVIFSISAKEILKFLGMGGVLAAALVAPNAIQVFRFLLKDKNYVSWKKFNQSLARQYIDRLEKRKLIKRKSKDNQIIFGLTKKGENEFLKHGIDKIRLKENLKWDHKWRVVIFDISEPKKKARDALRDKFKKLGMFQLQKSVFVYPFDCKEEIDMVSDFFGVGNDILYLEAEIHDIGKKLKRIFGLP